MVLKEVPWICVNFATNKYIALINDTVVHPADIFENLPSTKETIHITVKSMSLGTIARGS